MLTNNNEGTKLGNMRGQVYCSRVNWEEELRGLNKEEKEEKREMIEIIVENNKKILEIQKTVKIRKNDERERKEKGRGNG